MTGRPLRTINSSIPSRLAESLKAGFTTGCRSDAASSQTCLRPSWAASAQLMFPSRVLISPLWPNRRMGWARGQRGKVLVLNRRW